MIVAYCAGCGQHSKRAVLDRGLSRGTQPGRAQNRHKRIEPIRAAGQLIGNPIARTAAPLGRVAAATPRTDRGRLRCTSGTPGRAWSAVGSVEQKFSNGAESENRTGRARRDFIKGGRCANQARTTPRSAASGAGRLRGLQSAEMAGSGHPTARAAAPLGRVATATPRTDCASRRSQAGRAQNRQKRIKPITADGQLIGNLADRRAPGAHVADRNRAGLSSIANCPGERIKAAHVGTLCRQWPPHRAL